MEEIVLKIKTIGEPILRKKALQVKEVTPHYAELLSKMARIMYDKQGVGLAANQVGLQEALIVVDAGKGLYKLINPKIVKKLGSQTLEEGCLSVPGTYVKVKRAQTVFVEALDQDGNPVRIEAEDLLACVFQHEIDHLNGKLIIDYASFFKRLGIRKKTKNTENEKKQ